MRRCEHQRAARDRGSLTIELAILFSVLLFTLLVIVQATLIYMARQAALAAARQGVEAARVLNAPAGAGPAAALQLARTAAPGWLTHPAAVAVQGRTDQVSVTGDVLSLVPGLPIRVAETVQAPAERFTTEPMDRRQTGNRS